MLDFNTMQMQLDEMVQELDLEILRFHRACQKQPERKRVQDTFCFDKMDEVPLEKAYQIESHEANASIDSTTETVSSASTYYSDCTSVTEIPGTEMVLTPSQVDEFGWKASNLKHMSIEVHSTLFGRTVGEMSPRCEPPVIVMQVRLGQYRWYSAKSIAQLRAFDGRVREWLELEKARLPRMPDLNTGSGPERAEHNRKVAEDYFAVLSSSLLRSSEYCLGLVKDFACTDVIVTSPTFHLSAFVYVRQPIGHKLRFVVFTNSHINFYDGAGGKLLESMRLYLSSVQRVQGSSTALHLAEFDQTTVNIKNQTTLSFESEHECLRWMAMLQDATYNQGSCTQTLAALPFTISSW